MSKYLKNLMTEELKSRLTDVSDLLLVNVIGMEAESTVELRRELRQKDMHLMVVKNSLARRATEGTTLAPAFEGSSGTSGCGVGRRRRGFLGERNHTSCRR